MAVGLISAFYGAVDRVNRIVEMEREHLEDLLAEGKAKYEMDRARAARRAQAAPAQRAPGEAPRQERAA